MGLILSFRKAVKWPSREALDLFQGEVTIGNTPAVKEFLDAYGDTFLEKKGMEGNSPLITTIINDKKQTFDFLLSRGADINSKSRNGTSALSLAGAFGRVEFLKDLLMRGAEIETETDYGFTPLLHTTFCREKEGVEILLEKGANPFHLDKENRDAFFLARENKWQVGIDILDKWLVVYEKKRDELIKEQEMAALTSGTVSPIAVQGKMRLKPRAISQQGVS